MMALSRNRQKHGMATRSSAYHYDRPLVIVSAFYKSMLRNIMQRFGPEFWVAWSRATYETLQFIIRQVRQGF